MDTHLRPLKLHLGVSWDEILAHGAAEALVIPPRFTGHTCHVCKDKLLACPLGQQGSQQLRGSRMALESPHCPSPELSQRGKRQSPAISGSATQERLGGAAQGWENSPALAQPPLGKQCPGELWASPGRWEARQPLQKSKQEISQRLQALGTSLGEQMGREHRSNLQTLRPLPHSRGWQENLGVGCLPPASIPLPYQSQPARLIHTAATLP